MQMLQDAAQVGEKKAYDFLFSVKKKSGTVK
jgi:hypothetical protein